MTARIVRLNAASLSAVFDRPTVEALMHLVRIAGNSTDGVTVPELVEQTGQNGQAIQDIKQNVVLIQLATEELQYVPIAQPVIPPQDAIYTEIRQIAEQLTVLSRIVEDMALIRPDQVATDNDFLVTEVRQLAEMQAQILTSIDDIKQGTML